VAEGTPNEFNTDSSVFKLQELQHDGRGLRKPRVVAIRMNRKRQRRPRLGLGLYAPAEAAITIPLPSARFYNLRQGVSFFFIVKDGPRRLYGDGRFAVIGPVLSCHLYVRQL
jgi:hypothetical protein